MADIQKLNVNSTTYDISVPWGKVTGKPSTFPAEAHTHPYLPLSGGTLNDSATLTVHMWGVRKTVLNGNDIIFDFSNDTGGYGGGLRHITPNGEKRLLVFGNGGDAHMDFDLNVHGAKLQVDGNVLIGTTRDKGYKLDVNGTTCIRSGNYTTLIEAAAGKVSGSGIAFWNGSGWQKATINASTLYLNNDNTGNVLIGTETDAGYKFSVNGDALANTIRTQELKLGEASPGGNITQNKWYYASIGYEYTDTSPATLKPDIVFKTMYDTYVEGSGVERMRIKSNGNIGIGTTNPQYKLDVNGSLNATTIYQNGTAVSLNGHTHDDRYYTESEVNTKLNGKSDTGHTHSYLPLSGGTLTGPIDLPGSHYSSLGLYAMNLNNSDIIGLNGIYTQDSAQDPAEGINFARSNSNWDSLASYEGTLYYYPNRSDSVSSWDGGQKTIIHSGNVGDYAAAKTHTHDYLPLTGGYMTGSIGYSNGGYPYNMIKFMNGNADGCGIIIGGGGATVIGSGESANACTAAYISSGNNETMIISGDSNIDFFSNCQNGVSSAKTFTMSYDGNFYVGSTAVSLNGHTHSYLPLSGGSLTGNLYADGYIGMGSYLISRNHYLFVRDNSNADWIVTDKNWQHEYSLIHSGNISSYALTSLPSHTHNYYPTSGASTLNIIGSTVSSVTYDSANPKIVFDETGADQKVCLVYNDHDVYREPAGLKVCGNQGGEWFEVAGNVYANRFYRHDGVSVSYDGHTHSGYASSSHSHNYLPLTGGYMTGGIGYAGSQASYIMIRFINNTSDTYGNGISIGGGGATVIGGGESASACETLLSSGGDERMIVANDQDIEFYTYCQDGISNAKKFVMNTSGQLSAPGGFFQSSDERLKTFHDPIKVDLEKLKTLRKNYFKFNDKDKLEIGVSAQEIQNLYPEIVTENDEGYLSVAYDKLSVIALSAIDKLDDDIKELKQENNDLKDQLKSIKDQLKAIKNILKEEGIL